MIEPLFEDLARDKTKGTNKVAFAKVDIGVGGGNAVAAKYGVRATPTFYFFLDGDTVGLSTSSCISVPDSHTLQVAELRGADPSELRTQVDLLLFQAFPRTSMILRSIIGC